MVSHTSDNVSMFFLPFHCQAPSRMDKSITKVRSKHMNEVEDDSVQVWPSFNNFLFSFCSSACFKNESLSAPFCGLEISEILFVHLVTLRPCNWNTAATFLISHDQADLHISAHELDFCCRTLTPRRRWPRTPESRPIHNVPAAPSFIDSFLDQFRAE